MGGQGRRFIMALMIDQELLNILVCPVSRAPLEYDEKAGELLCRQSGLAYPVRDGIPVLLESEARPLSAPAAEQKKGD